MNALSELYAKHFRRQADKDTPKGTFTKGIMEGKLMGKEFRGLLLNILLTLYSSMGQEML